MITSEMFERFSTKFPIPVALRATVEHVLSPEKLDPWFDLNTNKQYTRNLLFSTTFDLMGAVVFNIFPSIHAAYQDKESSISASIKSVYNKLNGVEPSMTAALVHDTGEEMADIVEGLKSPRTELLPGYKVKILDGNCIEKTEHRLEVTRYTTAGPLPGKSLVIYDHRLDLVTGVIPCEEGHAQERSLLGDVLAMVQPGEVWVADRNFCVQDFISGISLADGYFVIRQHKNMPVEIVEEKKFIGKTRTGKVYEQKVRISDSEDKNEREVRLITVKLKKATRDNDKEIALLSNLPAEVSAIEIAELYRHRGSIETMFQQLTEHFHSEINTLGYPRAALFGFCLSLVAYNLLSVIKAAMRSVHGEKKIEEEVSGYYIAGEISRTLEGMNVALSNEEWECFQVMPQGEFIGFLKSLMKNIKLSKYKKHKRGVKKPLPKRDKFPGSPHVSTFKLLNARNG